MKTLLTLSFLALSFAFPLAAAYAHSASASISVSVRILRADDVLRVGDGSAQERRPVLLAAHRPTEAHILEALRRIPEAPEGLHLQSNRTFSVSVGCESGVCEQRAAGYGDMSVRVDEVAMEEEAENGARPPLRRVLAESDAHAETEAGGEVGVTVHFE